MVQATHCNVFGLTPPSKSGIESENGLTDSDNHGNVQDKIVKIDLCIKSWSVNAN